VAERHGKGLDQGTTHGYRPQRGKETMADTTVKHMRKALQIIAFFPLAWAIFIGFYIDHLNQDPDKHNFGVNSVNAISVGMVFLNLAIAMPIRWLRLTATALLSVLVLVFIFELGLWWLPGAIMAIIVTIPDWKTMHAQAQ
jgi:hypothetical protein